MAKAAPAERDLASERAVLVERTITERRSVRHFRHQPVPRGLLERIIEAARWAPSPHNAQPWRFTVIVSEESRARLAAAMGVRFGQDLLRDGLSEDAAEMRVRASIERLTGAPALILVCVAPDGLRSYPDGSRQDAEDIMAAQSIGAAVQNLLLSAESLGLGACWVCAPLFCPEVASPALDLDPAWQPQALILIGYASRRPSTPQRRPVDSVVTYR